MKYIILLFLLTPTVWGGPPRTDVYAGGVNGFTAMLNEKNHDYYRHKKGGLFLHNNGWAELTEPQRMQMLKIFKGKAIAIEIGYAPKKITNTG